VRARRRSSLSLSLSLSLLCSFPPEAEQQLGNVLVTY
jgi:hypothetical protein